MAVGPCAELEGLRRERARMLYVNIAAEHRTPSSSSAAGGHGANLFCARPHRACPSALLKDALGDHSFSTSSASRSIHKSSTTYADPLGTIAGAAPNTRSTIRRPGAAAARAPDAAPLKPAPRNGRSFRQSGSPTESSYGSVIAGPPDIAPSPDAAPAAASDVYSRAAAPNGGGESHWTPQPPILAPAGRRHRVKAREANDYTHAPTSATAGLRGRQQPPLYRPASPASGSTCRAKTSLGDVRKALREAVLARGPITRTQARTQLIAWWEEVRGFGPSAQALGAAGRQPSAPKAATPHADAVLGTAALPPTALRHARVAPAATSVELAEVAALCAELNLSTKSRALWGTLLSPLADAAAEAAAAATDHVRSAGAAWRAPVGLVLDSALAVRAAAACGHAAHQQALRLQEHAARLLVGVFRGAGAAALPPEVQLRLLDAAEAFRPAGLGVGPGAQSGAAAVEAEPVAAVAAQLDGEVAKVRERLAATHGAYEAALRAVVGASSAEPEAIPATATGLKASDSVSGAAAATEVPLTRAHAAAALRVALAAWSGALRTKQAREDSGEAPRMAATTDAAALSGGHLGGGTHSVVLGDAVLAEQLSAYVSEHTRLLLAHVRSTPTGLEERGAIRAEAEAETKGLRQPQDVRLAVSVRDAVWQAVGAVTDVALGPLVLDPASRAPVAPLPPSLPPHLPVPLPALVSLLSDLCRLATVCLAEAAKSESTHAHGSTGAAVDAAGNNTRAVSGDSVSASVVAGATRGYRCTLQHAVLLLRAWQALSVLRDSSSTQTVVSAGAGSAASRPTDGAGHTSLGVTEGADAARSLDTEVVAAMRACIRRVLPDPYQALPGPYNAQGSQQHRCADDSGDGPEAAEPLARHVEGTLREGSSGSDAAGWRVTAEAAPGQSLRALVWLTCVVTTMSGGPDWRLLVWLLQQQAAAAAADGAAQAAVPAAAIRAAEPYAERHGLGLGEGHVQEPAMAAGSQPSACGDGSTSLRLRLRGAEAVAAAVLRVGEGAEAQRECSPGIARRLATGLADVLRTLPPAGSPSLPPSASQLTAALPAPPREGAHRTMAPPDTARTAVNGAQGVAAAVRRLLQHAASGRSVPMDSTPAAEWMRTAAAVLSWEGVPYTSGAIREAEEDPSSPRNEWGWAEDAAAATGAEGRGAEARTEGEWEAERDSLAAAARSVASRAAAFLRSPRPMTPLPPPHLIIASGEGRHLHPPASVLELLSACAALPPAWIPPALLEACTTALGQAAATKTSGGDVVPLGGSSAPEGTPATPSSMSMGIGKSSGGGGLRPPEAAAALRALAALRYVPDAQLLLPLLHALDAEGSEPRCTTIQTANDDALGTGSATGLSADARRRAASAPANGARAGSSLQSPAPGAVGEPEQVHMGWWEEGLYQAHVTRSRWELPSGLLRELMATTAAAAALAAEAGAAGLDASAAALRGTAVRLVEQLQRILAANWQLGSVPLPELAAMCSSLHREGLLQPPLLHALGFRLRPQRWKERKRRRAALLEKAGSTPIAPAGAEGPRAPRQFGLLGTAPSLEDAVADAVAACQLLPLVNSVLQDAATSRVTLSAKFARGASPRGPPASASSPAGPGLVSDGHDMAARIASERLAAAHAAQYFAAWLAPPLRQGAAELPVEALVSAWSAASELIALSTAAAQPEAVQDGGAGRVPTGGDGGAYGHVAELGAAVVQRLLEVDLEGLEVNHLVAIMTCLAQAARPGLPARPHTPTQSEQQQVESTPASSREPTSPSGTAAPPSAGASFFQWVWPSNQPQPVQESSPDAHLLPPTQTEPTERRSQPNNVKPQQQRRRQLADRVIDALAARLLARGDAYVIPVDIACAALRQLAAAGVLAARPELGAALHDGIAFRLADDASGDALADVCAALATGAAASSSPVHGLAQPTHGSAPAPVPLAGAAADPWVGHVLARGLLDELAEAVQRRLRLAPQELSAGLLATMAIQVQSVLDAMHNQPVSRSSSGSADSAAGLGSIVRGAAPLGAARLLAVLARGLSSRVELLGPDEVAALAGVFARCRPREGPLLQRLTEAAAATEERYTADQLVAVAQALYAGGATDKALYAPLARVLRQRAEVPGGVPSRTLQAAASLLRALRLKDDASALEQAFVRAMRSGA